MANWDVSGEIDKLCESKASGRFVLSDGTVCHLVDGRLHRDDGPSVEYSSGDRLWHSNDMLHRVDGPAIERVTGDNEWFRDGKKVAPQGLAHRVDRIEKILAAPEGGRLDMEKSEDRKIIAQKLSEPNALFKLTERMGTQEEDRQTFELIGKLNAEQQVGVFCAYNAMAGLFRLRDGVENTLPLLRKLSWKQRQEVHDAPGVRRCFAQSGVFTMEDGNYSQKSSGWRGWGVGDGKTR